MVSEIKNSFSVLLFYIKGSEADSISKKEFHLSVLKISCGENVKLTEKPIIYLCDH
jgi:hypothetical protein